MLSEQQTVELLAVLEHARRSAPLLHSSIHGEHHWQHVAVIGARLAAATSGADPQLALLFAVLHDSCRENEDYDPEHGHRAAYLLDELHSTGVLTLETDRLRPLRDAVARHDAGTTTVDPAIGVCWDADRLCLPRVGVIPRTELLSTRAGRAHREWAASLQSRPLRDWTRVLDMSDRLADQGAIPR